MQQVAVVAELPPLDPPTMASPTSLMSYNISLNLSSIFAMLPSSRLLTKLRRGVFLGQIEAYELPSSSVVDGQWSTETPAFNSLPKAPSLLDVDPVASFPGPWGFFTSWYMVGLFVMAVLLHRMQNVIIPSRIPSRSRSRHAYRFGPTFASSYPRIMWIRRLSSAILPLDFSRTTTRLMLHLPSAYFVSKMLLMWFLLVLQTSEMLPVFSDAQKESPIGVLFGWVESLGHWTSQKEMSEICWSTFCAVCGSFLVEGFVKALDGMGSGFPIGNVNPNTSPFNLVGYAFLLHVYSSPLAHGYKPENSPSRPDKHVVITITIPLLQLTIFHFLSIWKRLSTHRLLPTTLASMLSLAHFHGTLLSHFLSKSPLFSSPSPSTTSMNRSPTSSLPLPPSYFKHPTVQYPLLNYIPNIFETLLLGTILLTVFLNSLVQLLVRGRVDRVLSGLGVGPGAQLSDEDDEANQPGFFQSLPFEEDFGVLLLRVGIASLEATGLRGWGNEVAPIQLPSRKARNRWNRKRTSRGVLGDPVGAQPSTTYGAVKMGRLGVGEVQYGWTTTTPGSSHGSNRTSTSTGISAFSVAGMGRMASMGMDLDFYHDLTTSSRRRRRSVGPTQVRGLKNEVRTVDLGISESSGSGSGGPWRRWLREFGAFLAALWGVITGMVLFLLERARGRVRVRDEVAKGVHFSPGFDDRLMDGNDDDRVSEEERKRTKDREVYQRFLRGEDISDDEDEVDDPTSSDEDEEDSVDGEQDGEDEEEGGAEAVRLFTDLLRNSAGQHGLSSSSSPMTSSHQHGEMVLAHLMHGSTGASPGPLTRRRWNALVRKDDSRPQRYDQGELEDDDDDGFLDVPGRTISDPYGHGMDTDAEKERRRHGANNLCVICTTEGRDIICWPCRCLAMCDNCREALGSKSAPSKHRCPCCRQAVEGYSRIYIP